MEPMPGQKPPAIPPGSYEEFRKLAPHMSDEQLAVHFGGQQGRTITARTIANYREDLAPETKKPRGSGKRSGGSSTPCERDRLATAPEITPAPTQQAHR